MMKKYKDIFLKSSRFYTGLAIICFIFYMRVLKVRFPRDIIYLNNLFLLSVSCLIVGIHVYILKSLLKPSESIKFIAIFHEHYKHSLYTVFEAIYEYVPGIKPFLHGLSNFLVYLFQVRNYRFMFLAMDTIVRLFISSILVIDVCIMERFNLFYKALIWLSIPILLKVMLYVTEMHGYFLAGIVLPQMRVIDLPNGEWEPGFSDPTRNCTTCLAKLRADYLISRHTLNLYVAYYAYKSSQVIKYLSACISIHYIVGWGTIAFKIISSF